MKALFLSTLITALSIAGHHRKAYAEFVEELCVNGKVISTTTPAQGPNIAITSCQWTAAARIATDPSTAKSLVVFGGTTLGAININVGTPANPMAISITNGFTTIYRVALTGKLLAGSSVVITDCSFRVKDTNSLDFLSLSLTGTDLAFSRNLVTVTLSQQALPIPPCGGACTYAVNDNFFNYTSTSTSSVVQISSTKGAYHSITFVSLRNLFKMSTSAASTTVQTGYLISPASIVSLMQSPPSNWSIVTDQDARDVYGKSTYVIADNVFEGIRQIWAITDPDGADFTIENNTASSRGNAALPKYAYDGNYYGLKVAIRNNTLSSPSNAMAYIELTLKSLPSHSSILIQNNTLTTATTGRSKIVTLRVLPSTTRRHSSRSAATSSNQRLVKQVSATALRSLLRVNTTIQKPTKLFLLIPRPSRSSATQFSQCQSTLTSSRFRQFTFSTPAAC